ncbi:ABC transporter ATP-binding protein [Pseudovibrio sp. SPO723]|uniref:ABC transporter ATP-binding protein n=1 Tax=Nesiotobacter zosterae TaxID=392721 RepID=UPI0039B3CCEC
MTMTQTGSGSTEISLMNCAKSFGGQQVLKPVTLTIEAGETLVLLGPSGCGKTTLLRIISGLESPDNGSAVLFNGEDVTRLPIEKRHVGMVFQSYALFPNMTVRQNVGYGLTTGQGNERLSKAERDTRVEDMLKMMRIHELADRSIDQLSGGQRQRVALARAIAPRPRVLLLDEPLTALDATLRDDLRMEINALLRSLGITAIYVTHDQAEAMALGDRIVVMSKGTIEQIGSPEEIYHQPVNMFVATFIGATNALSGKWTREGFVPDGQEKPVAAPRSSAFGGNTLCFRPETIERIDESHNAEGSLEGTVKTAAFLGSCHRVVVEMPGGQRLTLEGAWASAPEPGDVFKFKIDEGGVLPVWSTNQ